MKENKKTRLVKAYFTEEDYEIPTITKAVSAALTLACVKGC